MSAVIRLHLPPILLASLICILSSLPSPKVPGFLFSGADKGIHVILYLALTWLVHRSLAGQQCSIGIRQNALPLSALISVAYGLFDEWHQAGVPGRDSSAGDLMADGIGSILYVSICAFRRNRA